MYPEQMTKVMEEELTSGGIVALHSDEQVVDSLSKSGSTLVVVNSVCGCSSHVRPAVVDALSRSDGGSVPDRAVTVFAGVDLDATVKAREFFTGQQPSSPSLALLKDGKLLSMLHREELQGKSNADITRDLLSLFDRL